MQERLSEFLQRRKITEVRNSNLQKERKNAREGIIEIKTRKRCYEKEGIKYVTDLW